MLTQLERQLLRYEGMPARDVARAIGCTVDQVTDGWRRLHARGVLRSAPPQQGPAHEHLSFTDFDRMMRENRAPVVPSDPEIGWTPETEGSW
jgi:hypothetical protein